MKPYLPALLFILLFASCSDRNRVIFLQAERVDGLTTEATVTLNGFEIGQVDDIILNQKGELFIKLGLDQEPPIPADSKFLIANLDLLGSKGITVQLGTEKETVQSGDTLMVTSEKSILQTDSLTYKVKDFFEHLSGTKQRDSILYELQRLNNNLEDLKKQVK